MRKALVFTIMLISTNTFAGDAELGNQVVELKAELRSQHERIERLEQLILRSTKPNAKLVVADRFAWQQLKNWNRIKPGMSRAQVESILGKPTNAEVDFIAYVTLYYQGEKSGAGFISGNVELNSKDRVTYSGINKPVM